MAAEINGKIVSWCKELHKFSVSAESHKNMVANSKNEI